MKLRMLEDHELEHVTLKKHAIVTVDADLAFELLFHSRAEPTELGTWLEQSVKDYAEYVRHMDTFEDDNKKEENEQKLIL